MVNARESGIDRSMGPLLVFLNAAASIWRDLSHDTDFERRLRRSRAKRDSCRLAQLPTWVHTYTIYGVCLSRNKLHERTCERSLRRANVSPGEWSMRRISLDDRLASSFRSIVYWRNFEKKIKVGVEVFFFIYIKFKNDVSCYMKLGLSVNVILIHFFLE